MLVVVVVAAAAAAAAAAVVATVAASAGGLSFEEVDGSSSPSERLVCEDCSHGG